MSGAVTRARIRTPGTPTKVRSRRERISSLDEIPTKDISKSIDLSVGGTPKTGRFIQCSAVRRSCPEFVSGGQRSHHTRRHSETRGYMVIRKEAENRQRPRSQNSLVDPNVTNNSAFSSDQSVMSSATNNLSTNIYKLWKNGQLCDVIINAGGTRFYVHRLVMAASCEHFARHADTTKQTICEYDVPNVSSEVMNEVLDYFYTSKLTITQENIQEMLEISQNLGIKKLLDKCIVFLMKINLNNAVRNRVIAQRYGLNGVISAIDKYVHEHFSALVTTSSFLQSDFRYIYDIISSDILTKPNELQIFHACAKWIDFKRKERIMYSVALMSLIRFGLIPASEIVAQVEPVTFIFEIPECRDMLYNAFRHHALYEESKISAKAGVASRSDTKNVQSIHGNNVAHTGRSGDIDKEEVGELSSDLTESSDTVTSMEYEVQSIPSEEEKETVEYDRAINEKSDDRAVIHERKVSQESVISTDKAQSQPMEVLAQRLSSISVKNRKISREDLAKFSDFFEPVNKTSEGTSHAAEAELSSLNFHDSAQHVSVSTSNGKKTKNIAKMFEESSPHIDNRVQKETNRSWRDRHSSPSVYQRPQKNRETFTSFRSVENVTELSPIKPDSSLDLLPPPQPRVIMVIGGAGAYGNRAQKSNVNNSVYQFDPDLNTWSLRCQLPLPVHYCATAFLDGLIYVIGGRLSNTHDIEPVKDCYGFDVTNDRWDKIAPLKTARSRHVAVTLNGAIYAIGGEDCISMSCRTVEIYDPKDHSWSFVVPMQEARVGPAVVAHRGRLYVAGGMMDVDKKFLLNTMEVYEPRTREWTFRYPLPVSVCGSAMAEIAGVLYMVGGFVIRDGEPLSLDSVFRYNDEIDSWDGYKTLHVPRHDAVAVALDTKLYIIGGESTAAMGHALSNVECIDVETNEHVPGIAPLLTPAYGISGCALE